MVTSKRAAKCLKKLLSFPWCLERMISKQGQECKGGRWFPLWDGPKDVHMFEVWGLRVLLLVVGRTFKR